MPPTPDLSGFIDIKKDNLEIGETKITCNSNDATPVPKMPIQDTAEQKGDSAEGGQLQMLQNVSLEPSTSLQVSFYNFIIQIHNLTFF